MACISIAVSHISKANSETQDGKKFDASYGQIRAMRPKLLDTMAKIKKAKNWGRTTQWTVPVAQFEAALAAIEVWATADLVALSTLSRFFLRELRR